MTTQTAPPDLAGLGIGPFNLSIAALLTEQPQCNTSFFGAKETFNWHLGI